MIKRQWRMQRIVAVAEEFEAARTAAAWLGEQLKADPSFGEAKDWRQKAGQDFIDNLEATYIVRMYAEFEAGLRDYWKTYLGRDTHPKMVQLLNEAIPNERFPRDWIDNADDVREYRNFLVHDMEETPPPEMAIFSVKEAKSHLCAYFSCLDAYWK